MTTLLRTELLKLRTTRPPIWVLSGTTAVLVLLAVVGLALEGTHGAPELGSYELMRQAVRSITQLAPGALLVLGILAAAGEFQHRTITTTLLVTPHRGRVLAAKVVLFAAVGAAYALALVAILGSLLVGWHLAAGETPELRSGLIGMVAGVVAICAMVGVAGVAIGALARNMTAAVVGAVAWTTIGEGILQIMLGQSRAKWLPGPASEAIIRPTDGMLSAWAGGAVFATYVAVLAVAAGVMWMRRDAV